LEDGVTVEVSTNEPAIANATIIGVLVNADPAKEALCGQEIILTHQAGSWRGTMQLSANIHRNAVPRGDLVFNAASEAQFEWLLVYVEQE